MKKHKKVIYILIAVAVIGLLVIISWMAMETGIEISSHADFCIICHAMEPMVDSYRDSMHGGNNPRGITAACTDCHVSHENIFAFFVGKAKSGTHDVWVTITTDESDLDWQAKRLQREEYVYDSGCLTCHQNLQAATADKKFHDNYFNGVVETKCVACHEEVGHAGLNKQLLYNKYKYHFDE